MFFPQGLLTLLAASDVVLAAPGLFRRQASCESSYACPFEIMANGCGSSQISDGQVRIPSSALSELGDGQARCNETGAAPVDFTLSNGQVTDSAGRLCEISSQDQFQCSAMVDAGATTTGFSVCNGLLTFKGNSSFEACLATGDIPGYNIYTAGVDQNTVTGCSPIQLSVPACPSSSSSSSICLPSTVTSTVVSTNVPAAVTVVQTATAAPVTVVQTQTQTAAPVTVVQTATAAPVTVVHTQTQTASAVTVVQTQTAAPVTVVQTQTAAPVTVVQTQTAAPVTVVLTQTHSQTATVTVTSVQTIVPTVPTSSAAQATCTNIARALGSSNFPNTIEVVNSGSSLSGSSYFGEIGGGNSTIFTFNPTGASGLCSLSFYFPTTAEIQAAGGTTAYQISSSSIAVTLYELASVAPVTSTYANKPARGASFSATLTPGTNTTFETFTCPTVQTSYELTATDSNTLSFFADYNLPVLSLVIASCN